MMKPYVPLDKRSKKQQRQAHRQQRETWDVHPVTKRVESKKQYDRKKRRIQWPYEWPERRFYMIQCTFCG